MSNDLHDASPPAPDPNADILGRLTQLEASVQQVRIMVESIAGNLGAMPSTLSSLIGSIHALSNSMSHLSHLTTMHAATVGNLSVSAGNILTQASAMYADLGARSGLAAQSCMAQPEAMFAMDSMLPGETGHI